MRCPRCGAQVIEGAQACPVCGLALVADVQGGQPEAHTEPTLKVPGVFGAPQAQNAQNDAPTPGDYHEVRPPMPQPSVPTASPSPSASGYPPNTASAYPHQPHTSPLSGQGYGQGYGQAAPASQYAPPGQYEQYGQYAQSGQSGQQAWMPVAATGEQGYLGFPGAPESVARESVAPVAAPPAPGVVPGVAWGYAGMAPGSPGDATQGALLPPRRQRRTWLVVGIIATLAVFLTVGAVGTYVGLTRTPSPTNATSGTSAGPSVILSDSLAKSTRGWTSDATHCVFQADGYHSIGGYICFSPVGDLADATVQVRAELRSGPLDQGFGLSLRRVSKGNEYLFLISGDGQWALLKCVNDSCTNIVDWTPSNAIHQGLRAANTLKARMQGNQLSLYINDTFVGSATDTSFTTGQIGVSGANGASSDVLFSNMLITHNSKN